MLRQGVLKTGGRGLLRDNGEKENAFMWKNQRWMPVEKENGYTWVTERHRGNNGAYRREEKNKVQLVNKQRVDHNIGGQRIHWAETVKSCTSCVKLTVTRINRKLWISHVVTVLEWCSGYYDKVIRSRITAVKKYHTIIYYLLDFEILQALWCRGSHF